MNIESVLHHLYSLHRFGIKPGLERTLELLDTVGNPHRTLKTIHVAGTNGKGSVCSLLSSVLQEAGYKVGLYTSPHIKRFNERIRINGQEISDENVVELANELLPKADAISATYFEVVTALAFMYYNRNNVDCAIIETGMGGRFDSTNVLQPLLSIITSIDVDHQEFLGTSLREIAFEKAGIIKPNIPVIIGEPRIELRTVFQHAADIQQSPVVFLEDILSNVRFNFTSNLSMNCQLTFKDDTYFSVDSPLVGEHQVRNIAMVVEATKQLQSILPVSKTDITDGIIKVRQNSGLQGRIQLVKSNPPIVMDVGHNVACLTMLTNTLQAAYPEQKWNIVFGVMEDKNYREMLSILAPICNTMYVGTANNPRALPSQAIYDIARSLNINSIDAIRIHDAVVIAVQSNQPVLIVGSFYIAEEAADTLLNMGIVV